MDLSREHSDPLADGLPPLVLDRQRVVHSAAFRRLQHKTQVFLTLESDHYRTRLTHTLEVAHLARCIAAALGLNVDLAEVVALAHDLGHPPFGHAGEMALNACMKEHGGFEHNSQSLRVVEYLEHPYPEFRGLNLTHAVRECLAKHTTRYDKPGPHALQDGRPPPLEGEVAALADTLAYTLHDLQDGLYAGLLKPEDLKGLAILQTAGVRGQKGEGQPEAWRGRLRPALDRIERTLLEDVAAEARRMSHTSDPEGGGGEGTVRLSAVLNAQLAELAELLRQRVYRHARVARRDARAKRIVKDVFEAYVTATRLLPARYAERVVEQGVHRVAADYIAGMTDRYCLREHARLFDPRMDV